MYGSISGVCNADCPSSRMSPRARIFDTPRHIFQQRLNVHNLHCSEQSLEQDSDLQNMNSDLRYSHLDQNLGQALDHIQVHHIYVFHLDKDLEHGLG